MPNSFFQPGRTDFFRPLTGPWRAVVSDVLVRLYEGFFGQQASLSHCIERDELRALVSQSVQEAPVIKDDQFIGDDLAMSLKDEQGKVNEIIRRLQTFGWIETFEDPGTRRELYRFTRAGQKFSELMAEYDSPLLRMTQRNVRNTRNSLKAYLENGDPYDLFMALDHSRRVVRDLAEDIAEIHEKRRQVIAEAAHEVAVTDYVAYMKEKFEPITSVKLRADSVYRHERDISGLCDEIRGVDFERLKVMERAARAFRPADPNEPAVINPILYEILGNIRDAMQSKMSELSAAVSAYTDRTSFLALQASIVAGTSGLEALGRAADAVARLPVDAQDQVLSALCDRVAPFRVQLLDQSCVRLRKGQVRAGVEETQTLRKPTREERLDAFLQQAESNAFSASSKDIRVRLESRIKELDAGRAYFLLSEVDIQSYDDLLFVTNAVESAHDKDSGELQFVCKQLGIRKNNGYVEFDDIEIRVSGKKPALKTAAA